MALKSIAVFIDGTPGGERRTDYAADLANRYGAHLIGIHVAAPVAEDHPADGFARGRAAIGEVIARYQATEEAAILGVGRRFAARTARQGLGAEFRVIWRNATDEDAVLNSLHSDLVIIGHPDPHDLPNGWTPERLLVASGVPVLMVPHDWAPRAPDGDDWAPRAPGGKVLVAWNASREARRAVADALPFLTAAHAVTVLVVDPDRGGDRHGEEPGADIALHLARHGVKVEVEQVASKGRPIAGIILDHATGHGFDLIVMGAYSRARPAEIIFGGVTRTLLKRAPVPVLMSH
jgi:nucleotide-binding universal stress UspA family protein